MNYPPANLWKVIQLDPMPESEPELRQVASNLAVPVEWTRERISRFLKTWNDKPV